MIVFWDMIILLEIVVKCVCGVRDIFVFILFENMSMRFLLLPLHVA